MNQSSPFQTCIVGLLLGFFSLPVLAQVSVRNVRINVLDEAALEILYDLDGNAATDSIFVQIRSQTNGPLKLSPSYLTGHWGRNVEPGVDRRIVWKTLDNGYELDEPIRASIFVKSTAPSVPTVPPEPERSPGIQTRRTPGPEFALLSLVAPGVGNIFVQTPHPKVGYRLFVTASCYGLMAYGLTERKKSRDAYTLYEQQNNRTTAQPYYDSANQHHHRYYLTTRLAGAVWITDIVATFIRGVQNRKDARGPRSKVSMRLGYQADAPTAVFRYQF